MNYTIMRIKKLTLPGAQAMAKHALRACEVPNADPSRTDQNVLLKAPGDFKAVMELIKLRTGPLKKRHDAVCVIELLIAASPLAFEPLSAQLQRHYFDDALQWVNEKFGHDLDNIVLAVIHLDEATPHLQILLTPINNGKLEANKMIGGPAGLSQLQTSFHAEVGVKYGMKRGLKGSRAKHVPMQVLYRAPSDSNPLERCNKSKRNKYDPSFYRYSDDVSKTETVMPDTSSPLKARDSELWDTTNQQDLDATAVDDSEQVAEGEKSLGSIVQPQESADLNHVSNVGALLRERLRAHQEKYSRSNTVENLNSGNEVEVNSTPSKIRPR